MLTPSAATSSAPVTATPTRLASGAGEVYLHPHFAVVSCYDELYVLLRNLQRGTLALTPAATATAASREPLTAAPLSSSSSSSCAARSVVADTAGVYPDAAEEGNYMWLSDEADTRVHRGNDTATRAAAAAATVAAASTTTMDGASRPGNDNGCSHSSSSHGGSTSTTPTATAPASHRGLRMLCVWDIDDTLLASGVSGVRQHNVFTRAELQRLFALLDSRQAGTTRHLLLSQGSIDDVFEPVDGAPLGFLRSYFARSSSSSNSSSSGGGTTHRTHAYADPTSAQGNTAKKHKGSSGSLSSLFGCRTAPVKTATAMTSSSSTRSPSSSPSTLPVYPGNWQQQQQSSNNNCVASADALVVLLDTVREAQCDGNDKRRALYTQLVGDAYTADATTLSTATPPATPSPPAATTAADASSSGGCAPVTGEHVSARWLLLRPDVWGVSLMPLHMSVQPSPHTAFVDAMVYHKMDIVWSLALSGHWDTVFFVDNNLAEVGVVRSGAQALEMLHMRHARPTLKQLLHSEYMQLAAAARLQRLARWRGCDVAVASPRQQCDAHAEASPHAHNGTAAVTPSPRNSSGVATAAVATTAAPPQQVHLVVTHFHMASDAYQAIMRRGRAASVLTQRMYSRRNADSASSSSSSLPSRVNGQPVLNGGCSCTDGEYYCLMLQFARQLATLFQLLDEKVRADGVVVLSSKRRWRPDAHLVRGCVWPTPPDMRHVRSFFHGVCDDIERELIAPLLPRNNSGTSSGGNNNHHHHHGNTGHSVRNSSIVSSSNGVDDKAAAAAVHALRTRAFVQHTRLQYSTLVIDPALTCALADVLHTMHTTESRLSSATAMQLQQRRAVGAADANSTTATVLDADVDGRSVRVVHDNTTHTFAYDAVCTWPVCACSDEDGSAARLRSVYTPTLHAADAGQPAALVVVASAAVSASATTSDDARVRPDKRKAAGLREASVVALEVYMHMLHRLLCCSSSNSSSGNTSRSVSMLTASADGSVLVDELARRRVRTPAQLRRVRVTRASQTINTGTKATTTTSATAEAVWAALVRALARRHAAHATNVHTHRHNNDDSDDCGCCQGDVQPLRPSQSLCVVTVYTHKDGDGNGSSACTLLDVGDSAAAQLVVQRALRQQQQQQRSHDKSSNNSSNIHDNTSSAYTTLLRWLAQRVCTPATTLSPPSPPPSLGLCVLALPDRHAAPSRNVRLLRFVSALSAQSARTATPLPLRHGLCAVTPARAAAAAAAADRRERTRLSASLHGPTPSPPASSSSSRVRGHDTKSDGEDDEGSDSDTQTHEAASAVRIAASASSLQQPQQQRRHSARTRVAAVARDAATARECARDNKSGSAAAWRVAPSATRSIVRRLIAGCAVMHAQLRRMSGDACATASSTTHALAVSTSMLRQHTRAVAALRRALEDVLDDGEGDSDNANDDDDEADVTNATHVTTALSSSSLPSSSAASVADVEALARVLALEQRRCAHSTRSRRHVRSNNDTCTASLTLLPSNVAVAAARADDRNVHVSNTNKDDNSTCNCRDDRDAAVDAHARQRARRLRRLSAALTRGCAAVRHGVLPRVHAFVQQHCAEVCAANTTMTTATAAVVTVRVVGLGIGSFCDDVDDEGDDDANNDSGGVAAAYSRASLVQMAVLLAVRDACASAAAASSSPPLSCAVRVRTHIYDPAADSARQRRCCALLGVTVDSDNVYGAYRVHTTDATTTARGERTRELLLLFMPRCPWLLLHNAFAANWPTATTTTTTATTTVAALRRVLLVANDVTTSTAVVAAAGTAATVTWTASARVRARSRAAAASLCVFDERLLACLTVRPLYRGDADDDDGDGSDGARLRTRRRRRGARRSNNNNSNDNNNDDEATLLRGVHAHEVHQALSGLAVVTLSRDMGDDEVLCRLQRMPTPQLFIPA